MPDARFAALLAALLAAPLHAAPGIEALKAAPLPANIAPALRLSALTPALPPALPQPTPPGALQAGVFQRGGFTWEHEAREAAQQAEANLRAAGVAVLGSAVLRLNSPTLSWGFRIDYTDGPGQPYPRVVDTYRSMEYAWEGDAASAMQQSVANLQAAGYAVVLYRVRRGNGLRYFYEVDYLRPFSQPPNGQILWHRSGLYPNAALAQRDMVVAMNQLRAQGYVILQWALLQDPRSRWFFWQLQYQR